MKVFFLLLTIFISLINIDKTFAGDTQPINSIEKIVVLIELSDNAITDPGFVCETIAELLMNPSKAPWGLLAASHASCNSKDKEFQVQPHELWRFKIAETASGASWSIERPLKQSGTDKEKVSLGWKAEASQILTASAEVRESFYEKENSIRIILASLMQQLPFFQNNTVSNSNTDKDFAELPAWKGNFQNVYVCVSADWQLFSVYLSSASAEKRKSCKAKNTWNVSLMARGSLNKQIEELLTTDIKNITEEVADVGKGPKPLKKRQFGITLQVGRSNYYTNLIFGTLSDFAFAGSTANFLVDYYGLPIFSRKKALQTNISMGINWHSLSSPVFVQETNTARILTLNSLNIRIQSGINVDFQANYRLIINPFLDYGFWGKYSIEGGDKNHDYTYKKSMQYGAIIAGEYRFESGLKAGIGANVLLGSFSLEEQDDYSDNKQISLFGLGEHLYIGWNI